MRSIERAPYFALFVCPAFVLPINLSLSQPMSFLAFTVPILFAIPPWGEQENDCLVLSCQLGSNHDN